MDSLGWQHPRSWLTKTATKDTAKGSEFRWCQLVTSIGPSMPFRENLPRSSKDLTHFCFDERWMVEYPDISISVGTGIQHMWSTRWSQFSSHKRRIWEARTFGKRTNMEQLSATLKRKQLTAMEHYLPKEEPCQMHSSLCVHVFSHSPRMEHECSIYRACIRKILSFL